MYESRPVYGSFLDSSRIREWKPTRDSNHVLLFRLRLNLRDSGLEYTHTHTHIRIINSFRNSFVINLCLISLSLKSLIMLFLMSKTFLFFPTFLVIVLESEVVSCRLGSLFFLTKCLKGVIL